MIQKVIVGLVACFVISGCASMPKTVPVEERQLQRVYDVPNLSKDQIYSKTLSWMAETYNSSKHVIELQDKESGRIVGNAITTFNSWIGIPLSYRYTISVDTKDNKIRVQFRDFISVDQEGQSAQNDYEMGKIKANLEALSDNLYQYLTKKDHDW
jgi:predicted ATP-dependent protease